MAKKSLKEAVLMHEISINFDKVYNVLVKLKFIKPSDIFIEDKTWDWLDSKPQEKDMDKVLKKLGY